ncbi:ribulose-phosphate 3-epimerase [Angomonas deanei]|uniref:ribulose-phosphate 3-epimerase n=1 Tax=Angomonas deanei TaxID=59799 RepID=S9U8S4_9TRYP|nr:ribulose-phosphate 3-epimerase [Angomonas deanei]EPY38345.1 ribulose-phosphate 3-epimerase [Angomonas deanei]EPY41372.1 ribulose-phosphate 3-epimerase [Angomonas deanei]EPY42594.1 ribulose-phosphate 3-epimerase [Angomonas deanei]CAD2217671.1 Ribulose-phosphate 3 epimerase family, putative [Angomonas deanei]|eukprot:EPY25164.1 ribulose-phosphate 3-epimerase [Angomonas deanei]
MSETHFFDHNDKTTWLLQGDSTCTVNTTKLIPVIAPSILASDFTNLEKECADVIRYCEWLHVDVMDGHFVPNISIGPGVVECLRKTSNKLYDQSTEKDRKHWFLDVHLMVSKPLQWIEPMATAGASQYTFHVEAALEEEKENNKESTKEDLAVLQHVCETIHAHGMQCGIALKPATELTDAIFTLIDTKQVDMLLIMTVEPGFGGQSFRENVLHKVRALRDRYPLLPIEVDGGLSEKTIDAAAQSGANVIVAGTSVFKAADRPAEVRKLKEGVLRHVQA